MNANPVLGVLLHAVGGLMAASFYIPLKAVRQWRWESFWLMQGVFAWLVMPIMMASLTVPEIGGVLTEGFGTRAALYAFLFGALWGVGGLTFGLSMRYLGMSLGYALALGFCAAFGTMIPPLATGDAAQLFGTVSGWFIVAGVGVCLAGITVCCYAGTLKEKAMSDEEKRKAIAEFALTKGFGVAVFSGIMSACMAFALAAGKPIGDLAVAMGAKPIYQNNAVLVFVLAGGFATNFIWCLVLNIVNKSGGDYGRGPVLSNMLLCAAGGATWYLQFFFYGMGTTQMGRYDFASWTIHMAFIIAFSNVWALILKEWRGAGAKIVGLVYAGIGVLIVSTCVVGVGNYVAALEKVAATAVKGAASKDATWVRILSAPPGQDKAPLPGGKGTAGM